MKTLSSTVLVLLGWAITVVLTYHLLSGPFDARSCQAACVSTLYWVALGLAVIGVAVSLIQQNKQSGNTYSLAILLVGLALLAVLLGVMFVGIVTS